MFLTMMRKWKLSHDFFKTYQHQLCGKGIEHPAKNMIMMMGLIIITGMYVDHENSHPAYCNNNDE